MIKVNKKILIVVFIVVLIVDLLEDFELDVVVGEVGGSIILGVGGDGGELLVLGGGGVIEGGGDVGVIVGDNLGGNVGVGDGMMGMNLLVGGKMVGVSDGIGDIDLNGGMIGVGFVFMGVGVGVGGGRVCLGVWVGFGRIGLVIGDGVGDGSIGCGLGVGEGGEFKKFVGGVGGELLGVSGLFGVGFDVGVGIGGLNLNCWRYCWDLWYEEFVLDRLRVEVVVV